MNAAWVRRLEAATPWTDGGSGAGPARLLFAAGVAVILAAALYVRPLRDGDTGEYLLMTESLFRHGTPDLRPADIQSLARLDRRAGFGLNFAPAYLGYYQDPQGRWYSYHFWSYPLAGLPARLVLALPGNGIRALPLTNALLLLFALHQVLFRAPFRGDGRIGLFVLVLVSPLLWFVRWPHPEAMTASCVLLALVGHYRGLRRAPVFWVALASLQAPPLILLVGLLWAWACLEERRASNVIGVSVAAIPALVAPLFFLWHFGTTSVIGREATSLSNLSCARALELFFDLNLGLLPYLPVVVALFLVAAGAAILRARKEPFDAALLGVVFLMALACTVTHNWNHGTVGPSRYAIWLSPIVVVLTVRAMERHLRARPQVLRSLLGLAVAAQGTLVVAKGGLAAEPDHLDHSYAARLVLAHAPSLYNPSYPIFISRTTHDVFETAGPGPFVYLDRGRCRKVLARARPRQLKDLREKCGFVPAAYETWFGTAGAEDWRYIDY